MTSSRRKSMGCGILPALMDRTLPNPAPALFLSMLFAVACPQIGAPDDDDSFSDDDDSSFDDDDSSSDDDDSGGPPEPRPPLPWTDAPCEGIPDDAGYESVVSRWTAQDGLAAPEASGVVVVGSSSIRRWDGAHRALSPWGGVIQRGFGGSKLWEVARLAPELILAHEPGAVVVFAGTNDIAGGDSAADVVRAFRCLAEQVYTLEPPSPLFFIGITPAPARWATWDRAAEANAEVELWADRHPDLHYIDVPEAFLWTGSPPDQSLFVADLLHLSPTGYALWTSVATASVDQALEPAFPALNPEHPAAGARIRVDLGPDNPEDGTATRGIDAFGLVWNTWHSAEGGEMVFAGERLGDLLDTDGAPTGIDLVVSGGFRSNGLVNGGLIAPDPSRLGDLAVGTATQDYFYVDGPDAPGGVAWVGLDPARTYTLRLFGSRDAAETRVTRYRVDGSDTTSVELTTSGPDIGAAGYDGNDDTIVELAGIAPDAWGRLHVDVDTAQGAYSYLALVELQVE